MGKYLALVLALILFALSGEALAQEVTITTYYPAPYGRYEEIWAMEMVAGSTGTPAPSPLPDGDDAFTSYGNIQVNAGWVSIGARPPDGSPAGFYVNGTRLDVP